MDRQRSDRPDTRLQSSCLATTTLPVRVASLGSVAILLDDEVVEFGSNAPLIGTSAFSEGVFFFCRDGP